MKSRDFVLKKIGTSSKDPKYSYTNHKTYGVLVFFKGHIKPVYVGAESVIEWSNDYKIDFVSETIFKTDKYLVPYDFK